MNKSLVFRYLARIMVFFAALFIFPIIVCIIYGEYSDMLVFGMTCIATVLVSAIVMLLSKPKTTKIYARESLVITALLWIFIPVVGAVPFYVSGAIPSFVDAVFESISGFTTTGSTILTDIESLSHGMLFWRSFTHWVGGMGVLVLAIAVLPSSGEALMLMRAECAGPQVGKVVPKGKNSALLLYGIYFVLTLVTVIFLVIGGMPLFDSICHAMGTAGTGGFGIKNTGIAYYDSAYIEGVLTIGMLAFGVNFSLYYYLLAKKFGEIWKNSEIKVYLGIVAVSTVTIMLNIMPMVGSLGQSFRQAVFQVSSIMTSTGFGTADFNLWPTFSQTILIILMFIGACAGSTGGGFKVQRVIILFKSAMKAIKKAIRPNSVNVVKADDRTMDPEIVHSVQNYLIIYILLLALSVLVVAIDNADFTTTFTAVVTCINNIGPGLAKVGPTENFSFFSGLSKIVLSADMLLGRLECLPLVILFSPAAWRKSSF